jgi:hypothetical protein
MVENQIDVFSNLVKQLGWNVLSKLGMCIMFMPVDYIEWKIQVPIKNGERHVIWFAHTSDTLTYVKRLDNSNEHKFKTASEAIEFIKSNS